VIVLSADDLRSFFSLIWGLVAVMLAANEHEAWRAMSHGRRAAVLVGVLLLAFLSLVFALQWLPRNAAMIAGASLLFLSGKARFVRKLAGTNERPSEPGAAVAATRVASAWLAMLGLVLLGWAVLPRGAWRGWTLGSGATFLALEGFAALVAWRGRRYWGFRLLGLGTMVALAIAFLFTDAYFFGFMPAPALPVAFPVAWMAVVLLLTPLLVLFRLKPHDWWFPEGETPSGGSRSWSSGGSYSGSSGGSSFSGGGGSFGGGGASGSW
jgi:uncharacterized membrane protein YgcG